MERGYVKLWRKTLDSGLLQNATAWQVFSYLLLKATHKPTRLLNGATPVTLEPGQVLSGRKKIAQECKLSEQNVRTAISCLEKLEILTIKTTNKYTIFSFTNWSIYQQDGPAPQPTNQPTANQQLTSNQPTANHIQEHKNIRTEEEIVSKETIVDEGSSPSLPAKKAKGPEIPLCPHEDIRTIYAEVLSELPQPKVWDGTDEKNLRTRWRERYIEGKYSNTEQGLVYWRKFFLHIRECPFLMGKVCEFVASLSWIVQARNFKKIVNGNYDRNKNTPWA